MEATVATLQSRVEARRLARALQHLDPRIGSDIYPALTIGADDPRPAGWAPRFATDERAQIERYSLDARAELLACGATPSSVDSVLPVTAEGQAPWH